MKITPMTAAEATIPYLLPMIDINWESVYVEGGRLAYLEFFHNLLHAMNGNPGSSGIVGVPIENKNLLRSLKKLKFVALCKNKKYYRGTKKLAENWKAMERAFLTSLEMGYEAKNKQ